MAKNKDSGLTQQQRIKYKLSNLAIWGSLLVVAFITINQTLDSGKDTDERVVRQEDVYCVSAICLLEGPTSKCTELNPSVSHVVITEDPKVKGAHRIVVNPTGNLCGTSVYLDLRNGNEGQ